MTMKLHLLLAVGVVMAIFIAATTACNGDINAESGCGLNCNKKCSNVGQPPGICPRIQCPPHGCECKSGFYYNSNTSKCVLPENCN